MARRREMTDFVDGVKLRGLLWSLYRQFLALFVGPAPKVLSAAENGTDIICGFFSAHHGITEILGRDRPQFSSRVLRSVPPPGPPPLWRWPLLWLNTVGAGGLAPFRRKKKSPANWAGPPANRSIRLTAGDYSA